MCTHFQLECVHSIMLLKLLLSTKLQDCESLSINQLVDAVNAFDLEKVFSIFAFILCCCCCSVVASGIHQDISRVFTSVRLVQWSFLLKKSRYFPDLRFHVRRGSKGQSVDRWGVITRGNKYDLIVNTSALENKCGPIVPCAQLAVAVVSDFLWMGILCNSSFEKEAVAGSKAKKRGLRSKGCWFCPAPLFIVAHTQPLLTASLWLHLWFPLLQVCVICLCGVCAYSILDHRCVICRGQKKKCVNG